MPTSTVCPDQRHAGHPGRQVSVQAASAAWTSGAAIRPSLPWST